MTQHSYEALAGAIDHALLQPTMTRTDLERGCAMAAAYGTASVCILPYAVDLCAGVLQGSGVRTSTVIGFPHGGQATQTKVFESKLAITQGAVELDMVVNVSRVLSEDSAPVAQEIAEIASVCHGEGARLKVIFENCYLEDAHKIRLCEICAEAGVDWVKTSTGFGTGGATDADLKLMLAHSPAPMQVKAAGGIRTWDRLIEVVELGCTRVGAAATQAILDEGRDRLGLPKIAFESRDIGGSY